jgi:hypothetical protein
VFVVIFAYVFVVILAYVYVVTLAYIGAAIQPSGSSFDAV